ncbi:alpha-D-ribose 1-methylphosphonate 5-triphosphate synthase subunit PhnH [Tamaricihabitans halophyticus]|uniref:Alpha-D-ribose 1-methylphosphonate 5-triphosphate synthase subunit PhnH n=1 Tax=Tamaricihabitans halophyticus TaxID=1262583 RepID=A0A4R2QUE6_9PSEU|nr:phosphonate C-P lyase system protein PhnH [Tamaricihabitans halophyticus]TCP53612.1 alpha-D-ribose 1-methylphosphonate 5-triphosphate synthase subunit PhnH [Tamaricihabitans halophyticus]
MTGVLDVDRTVAERVARANLLPDDAQRVFRAVLDALSRPGQVQRLATDPASELPPVLLPVLALADLGTGVYVRHEDPHWVDVVRVVTNAPIADLGSARLVAAEGTLSATELAALPRGSASAPEHGALVALAVSDVDGGATRWQLSGPGVPGELRVSLAGVGSDLLAARDVAVAGYPAGIDLLLVAPDGRMVGLPRTTAVTELED